jgi:hypothetical protein
MERAPALMRLKTGEIALRMPGEAAAAPAEAAAPAAAAAKPRRKRKTGRPRVPPPPYPGTPLHGRRARREARPI